MVKSSTKTDTRKKALLQALTKSLGIVSQACKAANITRDSHYKWMKTDPDYKKAVESIGDMALDFAESKLHANIEEGKETSILFFLKCKGKGRGYIEKSQIDIGVTPESRVGALFAALEDGQD